MTRLKKIQRNRIYRWYARFYRENKVKLAKYIIVLMISFLLFAFYLEFADQVEKEKEQKATGKSRIPFPFEYRGVLNIEIDYSENISINGFERILFNDIVFSIFHYARIFTNIIWSDSLNVSSISFKHSNCSEYANLMNDTRDNENAIHILILEEFVSNGFENNWGYCMFLPDWEDMINNYSSPRYTGCVVAYEQIMNDTNDLFHVIKVFCHEIGHALGATHSQRGIMRQGRIIPFLELYFDVQSQFYMNPYNVWGIHSSFFVFQ